ncbi:MAG: SDR family NAD(P)-dependent oxidoreductase, partial [Trebonia sp.]
MAPDLTDLAVDGVRTLRALSHRIPFGGGILAPSLHNAVKGRTVLVTGASSGIGEATVLRLGAAGGKMLLIARTRAKLQAVAGAVEDRGGSAFVHTCDLSEIDDVDRMAKEVLADHGHVDI